MDPVRLRRRGHNQAETLARALGEKLGTPFLESPLIRMPGRPPQHTLTRAARARNAAGSFAAGRDLPLSGRILLVDDVVTTGATAHRCAALLLELGAARVDLAAGAAAVFGRKMT